MFTQLHFTSKDWNSVIKVSIKKFHLIKKNRKFLLKFSRRKKEWIVCHNPKFSNSWKLINRNSKRIFQTIVINTNIVYYWYIIGLHSTIGMNRFHFFEKRSFRFENDQEKTKNGRLFKKTIVFWKNDRFWKRPFVNDDSLLTTVNDDPTLTIVNDLLKRKYIFLTENPRSENIQVICFNKKKHLRQHS